MKKQVLSTIPLFDERCKKAKELLIENGYEIIEYQGDTVMTSEEIKAAGSGICAAIVGCEAWDEELYEACPELKVLARFGVGVDCIDLEGARRHGIKVCNARGMNCKAVGEATVMFALASLRNLVELTDTTKEGKWIRYTGRTLSGKTYGLVGFGAVARYVAKLLQSFGVEKILAYDIYQDQEAAKDLGVTFTDMDTLLKSSDVISLHIPGTAETRGLIGEREISLMKRQAVLINAARGCVVDEKALYHGLKEGKIAAAALDVFEDEPVKADNPLLKLKNLICMPHQAADTYETFESVAYFDAEVILDVMNGKEPRNWLNP